jgi:hypothetical protein
MEPISLEISLGGYNDLFAVVSRMYPEFHDNILYYNIDNHMLLGERLSEDYFKNLP